MIEAGVLVPLKKGLYVLGPEWRQGPLSLPLIGNHLYGPSCVSLEWALAWHGVIPEGVISVTSVTSRRGKHYETPVGHFSYQHVPVSLLFVGARLEEVDERTFCLLAGPTKALCGKVLPTRNLRLFSAFGFELTLSAKKKSVQTEVESAFLKKTSSLYDLAAAGKKTIKIKLEVDKDPPQGFATEERLLIQPFSFYTKCFALPDLFADKMHALLYRQWKNRVKGRDWFDFEWYVRQGVPLGLKHFVERGCQSEDLKAHSLSTDEFLALLHERIDSQDVRSARQDVISFVPDPGAVEIWSRDYFHTHADMVRFA
ncbi:hypothetical protein GCM10007392_30580 [Saccharospirillum salsuginis]|uniref:Transcriptional regulator, AbiEi antitoxin, Type IV TA system n=1 Tax=Saccharospirillum salsuginis TaxID=418750 RepID=A0A918NE30_9GAMM|nr:hypothetical protein GCM10007392_30580 [Saccharospirillum salsuginis]